MRQVTYITGTRADFGLMEGVLRAIDATPGISLNLIVTGMHLIPEYGLTVREIEESGLTILERVEVDLSGGDGCEMSVAVGNQILGITNALAKTKPDILLLLGDRGEMLAGAVVALHLNIHAVHIHGGELSGTIDESIRHAISKLSHYHFTATEKSRDRLLKMGERPEKVFVTGAPGLDSILNEPLIERDKVFSSFGLSDQPTALVLFHPVVQQAEQAREQMDALVNAVLDSGLQVLIILPNADSGGEGIRSVIDNYRHESAIHVAVHASRVEFLSLLAEASVMVGNSSSGIIEAASLRTPVVNVGDRQKNRERNTNVIDCCCDREEIAVSIDTALARGKGDGQNIYGDGMAASRIVKLLREIDLDRSVLEKINAY